MTPEERLSAYLDGALEPAAQAALELEMERDPTMADELARLMANDRLLRAALAEDASDDPQELAGRFGLRPPAEAEAPAIHRSANDNHIWRWAAVGTGAAAVLAWFLVAVGPTRPGSQQDAFSKALDNTPSLQQASLEGGKTLTPRLTVRVGDGSFCREYRLADASRVRAGLACRRDGNWQVQAEEPATPQATSPEQIELAAGEASPTLDAAYRRLAASDPLDSQQERDLITRKWSSSKKNAAGE